MSQGVDLEGVEQAHQERMVDIIEKYIPLHHGVFHFIAHKDGLLLEHLDGIIFPSCNVFHQVNLYTYIYIYFFLHGIFLFFFLV